MSSVFENLSKVDVGTFVQRKDSLNYVSWVHAYGQLRRRYPNAMSEIIHYPDEHGNIVLPYLRCEVGYFVQVAVTIEGDRRACILPVMDEEGNSLFEPNALDINNSIQRCLVKAIALHGLGLHVYAGEESPWMFTSEEMISDQMDPMSKLSIPIFRSLRAIQGPSGPYYMMDLQIGEQMIEVAVVGELMQSLDELDLREGDPCQIFYEDIAGKFVATNIRNAS